MSVLGYCVRDDCISSHPRVMEIETKERDDRIKSRSDFEISLRVMRLQDFWIIRLWDNEFFRCQI